MFADSFLPWRYLLGFSFISLFALPLDSGSCAEEPKQGGAKTFLPENREERKALYQKLAGERQRMVFGCCCISMISSSDGRKHPFPMGRWRGLAVALEGYAMLFSCIGFLSAMFALGMNQADPPKPWQIPRVSHYEIQVGPEGQFLFAPGYYDKDSDTFHRWKGIAFPVKESPYRNPFRRMLTLDPREEKYRSTDFDPPISYLTVAPDQLAPGYYVPNQSVFYRWKDVAIKREELPSDKSTVIPANQVDATTVVPVPAPKHLLAKPELWKKTKK